MSIPPLSGLFVCEGSSDKPLADIVEILFEERGQTLRLSTPDFSSLPGIGKNVKSRIDAGAQLMDGPFRIVVVHRDADNAGWQTRHEEIELALSSSQVDCELITVIPITMTEAWLLLDEDKIRTVAGNPRGRDGLSLPKIHEVEGVADPKALLRSCLLSAASARGRRRDLVAKRFSQHRRQLLERLDTNGPVTRLSSWQRLVSDIDSCISAL